MMNMFDCTTFWVSCNLYSIISKWDFMKYVKAVILWWHVNLLNNLNDIFWRFERDWFIGMFRNENIVNLFMLLVVILVDTISIIWT